jgi:transcriptional regulator with XRE-family HTH domain
VTVRRRVRTARSPSPQSIAGRIGPRVRARRIELGISVRELARRIDVSGSFVSAVETGRTAPSIGTFRALASELDISAAELLADPAEGLLDPDRPWSDPTPPGSNGTDPSRKPPLASPAGTAPPLGSNFAPS